MPTSKWASSPRSRIPGTRAKSSFPWEGCMRRGPWRRSWASRTRPMKSSRDTGPGTNSTASSRAKIATGMDVPTRYRSSNEHRVRSRLGPRNPGLYPATRGARKEFERQELFSEFGPFTEQQLPAPARPAGPKLFDAHRLQCRAAPQAPIIARCRWRRSGRGPPGSFGHHGTTMGSPPLPLSPDPRRGTLPSAEGDALVRDLVLELRVRGLDRLHGFGRTLFREEKDHVEAELRGLDRRSEHAIADAGTQTELPGDDDAGDIEGRNHRVLRSPILPVDALQEAVIDHPPDILRRSLDRHSKFLRERSQMCVSLGRDRVQDEHRRRLAKVAQQLHGYPESFNTVKRIGYV